jgi:hypothetical protein
LRTWRRASYLAMRAPSPAELPRNPVRSEAHRLPLPESVYYANMAGGVRTFLDNFDHDRDHEQLQEPVFSRALSAWMGQRPYTAQPHRYDEVLLTTSGTDLRWASFASLFACSSSPTSLIGVAAPGSQFH